VRRKQKEVKEAKQKAVTKSTAAEKQKSKSIKSTNRREAEERLESEAKVGTAPAPRKSTGSVKRVKKEEVRQAKKSAVAKSTAPSRRTSMATAKSKVAPFLEEDCTQGSCTCLESYLEEGTEIETG
jgi:hypothetical protein